jgi:hypothetical protein
MVIGPKHPYAERARQRGAAVFVVLLVITLLTALGVFAVRSASLATRSTGHHRQLTQTHYVADYGIVAMAGDLGIRGDAHTANMKSASNTQCVGYAELAAPGPDQRVPTCAVYSYGYLDAMVVQSYDSNKKLLDPATSSVAGSLGPVPLEGDMRIEVTDWHPAWPPPEGIDASGALPVGYATVTVSVNGMVRPPQVVAGSWDTTAATAAGIEAQRAHVMIGPVQMQ